MVLWGSLGNTDVNRAVHSPYLSSPQLSCFGHFEYQSFVLMDIFGVRRVEVTDGIKFIIVEFGSTIIR